ncbi:MAG TPA: hypothetical protein ENK85_00255 [Saprospiraceae bacterium]|nr:hypothetical protein [Saprospiraceae bacterium]
MTTFQRLVKNGFEQGTEHGKEMQLVNVINRMLNYKFPVRQIAEILDVEEKFVARLADKM